MKVRLEYNTKKYELETKPISAYIKSLKRELDIQRSNKMMEILQKGDTERLTSISLDEMIMLQSYQKQYGNVMPKEIMDELKPIYKKMSDEVNDRINEWYLVELAKILLVSDHLKDDVKELFNGNFDNDFWYYQDEAELLKLDDFFRKRRI